MAPICWLTCVSSSGRRCETLGTLGDGLQNASHVGSRLHLLGDVRRVLDHFKRLALEVEDRVVGRLQPDLVSAFAQTFEFTRRVLAAAKPFPELAILRTLFGRFINEHAVVMAHNLVEPVSHDIQEPVVCRDDRAVQLKLDHRLGLADGLHLTREVSIGFTGSQLLGNVLPRDDIAEKIAVGFIRTVDRRP